jgi:3-oxoacyl-[acyl-carrier protein] reductase
VVTLDGRTALVTGVSRRQGIGFAIATRLLQAGASVAIQHWSPHDSEQPWGADDIGGVVDELSAKASEGARVTDISADFAQDDAPAALIAEVTSRLGHLDVLVCNQAMSGHDGALSEIGIADLELHWRVNARATLLMTQAYASQHDGRPGGRVVWLTSGHFNEGVPLSAERLAAIRDRFPLGRFGEPDDPARLIAWLVGDDARWVVGQVINTEGGFERWR